MNNSRNIAKQSTALLLLVILFHVGFNLYWQFINTAPPTWDSAGHLALSYIFADKLPEFLGGHLKISDIFRFSTYYPPFIQMLGGFMIILFGRNYETTILLGTFFFVIGIIYLFRILRHYFGTQSYIPILSVIAFSFFPGVWEQTRQFHLDIPLVSLMLVAYYYLIKSDSLRKPFESFLFFLMFALIQLTKWYGFVYLFIPLVAEVVYKTFKHRDFTNEKRVLNLAGGSLIMLVLAVPWYVINLQSIRENVLVAATADAGDPANVFSYESLFHYVKLMTSHQVGIVAVILVILGVSLTYQRKENYRHLLLALLLVPYAVFTVIQNKDIRYVLPLTPVMAVYIAYVLSLGREIFVTAKTMLYTGLMVVFYLFFSFNQFTQLPKGLNFLAQLYSGPGYWQVWVYEPYSYSYNAQDWHGEEIVAKLQKYADAEPFIAGKYNVLLLADNRFYSSASFQLYQLQAKFFEMRWLVPFYQFEPFSPEELNKYVGQVHFALVPENPGPPGLRNIKVLNQLIDHFRSGDAKDFILVTSFDMPDGNKLSLYKRANMLAIENTGVSQESVAVKVGNILFIDREKYPTQGFRVYLYDNANQETWIDVAGDGSTQRRIPLTNVTRIKIDLPPERQNIQELSGWSYIDRSIVRKPEYSQLVNESGNEFYYKDFRIMPKNSLSTFEQIAYINVVKQEDSIKVSLIDTSQTSYIAYATSGWNWSNVLLTPEAPEVVIPLENLIQLEVTQKHVRISGFDSNWGYFQCYQGNAVCFYPLSSEF